MTDPSAVDVPTDTVGRLRMSVTRLARLLRQQDQTGFGPTLTATLATIARHGPLTLGDLAAREQVAPPTITKVVDKLVAHGLVARERVAGDRRLRTVTVTAAGRRYLDAARTRRTAWLTARLAELSPDELDRLLAAVDVLERLTTAPAPTDDAGER